MKQLISAILVLVMVASMSAFALADVATPAPYSEDAPAFPLTPAQKAAIEEAKIAAEKAAAKAAEEAKLDTREKVDAYVCKVNARYAQVRADMKYGKCVANAEKTVITHFIKGDLVQLEKDKGSNNCNYYRNFTYDKEGNLVFCYYEGKDDSYRMYFSDDVVVYALYRNKVTGTSMIKYLEAAQEDLAKWAEFAVYEAKNYQNEFPAVVAKELTENEIFCAEVDTAVVKAYQATHHGCYTAVKVRTGVVANLVNGKCVTIDMAKGTNGSVFARRYYLDADGNMMYCEYKNDVETYSMYFNKGELVRTVYTAKNVVEVAEAADFEGTDYIQWAECAVEECSSIIRDAAL